MNYTESKIKLKAELVDAIKRNNIADQLNEILDKYTVMFFPNKQTTCKSCQPKTSFIDGVRFSD